MTSLFFFWAGQKTADPLTRYFLYLSALIALYLLITNVIPIKGTDGFHILQSIKNPDSNDEVLKLLSIYRDIIAGNSFSSIAKTIELKEQVDFTDPNSASFHSIHGAAYLESLNFEKAREIYAPFWENRELLFPAHQVELTLSYYFTLLLTDPENPRIPIIKKSKAYHIFQKMKLANSYRVLAAEALYLEKDKQKAQKLLALGEAKIHLSPSLAAERLEEKLYAYLAEDLHS